MCKNPNNYNPSKMYCIKCGKESLPIFRKYSKYREAGHLKKIYCIHCKDETNHVEIRPTCNDYTYNDFILEKQYNNFDNEGNRKEPYRIFRGKLKQKGII